jgi:hypothetical protein
MPRLLALDESVPVGLRGIPTAFEVKAAPEMELGRDLEREAPGSGGAAGFEIRVTADKQHPRPKTVGGTKNSFVVLTAKHWDTIIADLAAIAVACDRAGQGTYTVLNVARRPGAGGRPIARSSLTPSAPRCQRPRRV